MRLTTDVNDKIRLEEIEEKAKRLCLLYRCSLMDLMVLSITIQAQNKKEQNKIKHYLTEGTMLRPYKAFYKGKTVEVEAESSHSAQIKAAQLFKAKKQYDVTVMLLDVVHRPID